MQDDNEIIDSLGGTTRTSKLCDVSVSAVSQWRKNGIPKAQRNYLRLKCPDVFDVTAQHPPTPQPQAEPQ